jgi:threonine efflux protein
MNQHLNFRKAMSHELRILCTLIAVYVPLLMSPGPNFLVVTQAAISQSRRHAVYTALGISSGSTILACLAATGMGLLLAHFGWFNQVVRVLGGIYLFYIGVKIWRHASQAFPQQQDAHSGRSLQQSYWYGMATNLSNPKALVFFATMFASLLTPNLPTWARIAGVGAIGVTSTLWHVTLANWFSGTRMQQAYRGAKLIINRVTATVLVGVGIKLLLEF